MKNTCNRCGTEILSFNTNFLCYDCQKREEKHIAIFFVSVILLVFALIIGVKLWWAKYAYNDFRCALSECRILKD